MKMYNMYTVLFIHGIIVNTSFSNKALINLLTGQENKVSYFIARFLIVIHTLIELCKKKNKQKKNLKDYVHVYLSESGWMIR